MSPQKFRNLVWRHWRLQGRHDLPWRKTQNPYRILVSEVMLQQTQVDRVIPHYQAFLKQFPNPKALAQAPLSEVLIRWQGLGYNRRAKMLQEAAKASVERYGGRIPTSALELQTLPGVGPYTAGAVSAFAGNHDAIFIETNIRTAITHHFFNSSTNTTIGNTTIYGSVSDTEIFKILEQVHPKGKSREWYSALMDYGAFLKRSGVKLNARQKGYTKQSKFEGSTRQMRGAILRELTKGTTTKKALCSLFETDRKDECTLQLSRLIGEGMVLECKVGFCLAS